MCTPHIHRHQQHAYEATASALKFVYVKFNANFHHIQIHTSYIFYPVISIPFDIPYTKQKDTLKKAFKKNGIDCTYLEYNNNNDRPKKATTNTKSNQVIFVTIGIKFHNLRLILFSAAAEEEEEEEAESRWGWKENRMLCFYLLSSLFHIGFRFWRINEKKSHWWHPIICSTSLPHTHTHTDTSKSGKMYLWRKSCHTFSSRLVLRRYLIEGKLVCSLCFVC